jgi:hypothetical protein
MVRRPRTKGLESDPMNPSQNPPLIGGCTLCESLKNGQRPVDVEGHVLAARQDSILSSLILEWPRGGRASEFHSTPRSYPKVRRLNVPLRENRLPKGDLVAFKRWADLRDCYSRWWQTTREALAALAGLSRLERVRRFRSRAITGRRIRRG